MHACVDWLLAHGWRAGAPGGTAVASSLWFTVWPEKLLVANCGLSTATLQFRVRPWGVLVVHPPALSCNHRGQGYVASRIRPSTCWLAVSSQGTVYRCYQAHAQCGKLEEGQLSSLKLNGWALKADWLGLLTKEAAASFKKQLPSPLAPTVPQRSPSAVCFNNTASCIVHWAHGLSL